MRRVIRRTKREYWRNYCESLGRIHLWKECGVGSKECQVIGKNMDT